MQEVGEVGLEKEKETKQGCAVKQKAQGHGTPHAGSLGDGAVHAPTLSCPLGAALGGRGPNFTGTSLTSVQVAKAGSNSRRQPLAHVLKW